MSDLCFEISNFPIGAMLNRARLMGAPKKSEPGNTCWKCYELKAYGLRFYAAKWLWNISRTAFLMPPWYMALISRLPPITSKTRMTFPKSGWVHLDNANEFINTVLYWSMTILKSSWIKQVNDLYCNTGIWRFWSFQSEPTSLIWSPCKHDIDAVNGSGLWRWCYTKWRRFTCSSLEQFFNHSPDTVLEE